MVEEPTKMPVKTEEKAAEPTSALQAWRPLETLRREVDRLFENFDRDFWRLPFRRASFDVEPFWQRQLTWASTPAVDIVEKDNAFEVVADVPGFDEKNIEVKVARGTLTIKGAKQEEQEEKTDFTVDGSAVRVPVDGLAVRYGDGADAAKQALATTPNHYQVLDRRDVSFPLTKNNNAMVGYNTAVGTLAELAVDATSGKVVLLRHHTILECGNMLVPELVSSQIQGGTATGIGLALLEQLPLYEDGPGNGTWNFNRYHLPRGSDVAVWAQTAEILPPLSEGEPPKGMAEVVVVPIMAAIVNGVAHAIGHRFRTLPVTPDQILEVLA
jgi:CO/xanthine dehydrogenase Mo-binding subunit